MVAQSNASAAINRPAAAVDVLVDKFPQAQVFCAGERAGISHKAVVVKDDADYAVALSNDIRPDS